MTMIHKDQFRLNIKYPRFTNLKKVYKTYNLYKPFYISQTRLI